jgi:predicted RNA-binding Zn-ribbon protein involved in translation (DUF1610 family)
MATAQHVGHGWDTAATWDPESRVVVTSCAQCGQEIRLRAPQKPSQLALSIATRFECDDCEEEDR